MDDDHDRRRRCSSAASRPPPGLFYLATTSLWMVGFAVAAVASRRVSGNLYELEGNAVRSAALTCLRTSCCRSAVNPTILYTFCPVCNSAITSRFMHIPHHNTSRTLRYMVQANIAIPLWYFPLRQQLAIICLPDV